MNRNVLFILGLMLVVVVGVMMRRKSENYTPVSNDVLWSDNNSKNIPIHNHLSKAVVLYYPTPDGGEKFIARIPPKTLTRISDVHLSSGNVISVYYSQNGQKKKLGDYVTNGDDATAPRELHIGMVTSRWMGADGDNYTSPGLNAVQGLNWIKIHNTTDQPITLNKNITIAPGGTLRYTGRDHFGVRLGTVFKNDLYGDFIWSTPATDVYYGVVSDILQPEFGGWQISPRFDDVPNSPQFLLEKGWMGGPDSSQISKEFIPRLSRTGVDEVNRWGQKLS